MTMGRLAWPQLFEPKSGFPTHTNDEPVYSRSGQPLSLLNLLVKLLAFGLALIPLVAPDLAQFQGKWMAPRAMTYPFIALAIPALWHARGRPYPYPHLLDILLVLPFVLDMGVNALNLYDTVEGSDLVAHFLGWAILVTAFGMVLSAFPLSRLNAAALAVGFGATTHVLWEIAEYGMMKLGAFGLNLTYANTIHDFFFSFLGTVTGAVLTVTVLRSARPAVWSLFPATRRR